MKDKSMVDVIPAEVYRLYGIPMVRLPNCGDEFCYDEILEKRFAKYVEKLNKDREVQGLQSVDEEDDNLEIIIEEHLHQYGLACIFGLNHKNFRYMIFGHKNKMKAREGLKAIEIEVENLDQWDSEAETI